MCVFLCLCVSVFVCLREGGREEKKLNLEVSLLPWQSVCGGGDSYL